MATPTTRNRENTRARLLAAAAEVFAEVGLEGASVETICERAGFTRGAFYSNFESKEELFFALSSSMAAQHLEAVQARIDELAARGALEGEVDLPEVVQYVMGFGYESKPDVLLTSEIRIRALRDPEFAKAYLANENAMLAGIESILQGVVNTGYFVFRADIATIARMLVVIWEGGAVRGLFEGKTNEDVHATCSQELGEFIRLIIDPTG